MFKILATIIAVIIIISGGVFIFLKIKKSNKKLESQTALTFKKGVSFSPKSFEQADFTEFFEKAKQSGEIISWAGDFDELKNSQN